LIVTVGKAAHPAQFSEPILDLLGQVLGSVTGVALDPFAGKGNIHRLARPGELDTIGVELEPEWATCHPHTVRGDACHLPFPDSALDAVVTSPVYGNRMSDHHNAQERCKGCAGRGDGDCSACGGTGRRAYKRLTYTHQLGRPLTANNAGSLQWGPAYRQFHQRAWTEAVRVLKPGGLFVLNISDHIRGGKIMPVTAFHTAVLTALGVDWTERHPVETKRMKYGQHHDLRVSHEDVYVGVRK
jgi:tRNA G10  N-methylase Trm11